jgi:hypothetical protein
VQLEISMTTQRSIGISMLVAVMAAHRNALYEVRLTPIAFNDDVNRILTELQDGKAKQEIGCTVQLAEAYGKSFTSLQLGRRRGWCRTGSAVRTRTPVHERQN